MDYSAFILALDVWREASNQSHLAKVGVCDVVINRANHPGWWGHTIVEVVTHKWQFSGMTASGDPNLIRWPQENDPSWNDALNAVQEALAESHTDSTGGAVYYYTIPLTTPPTGWGPVTETIKIGAMHFCKPIEKLDE